MKKVLKVLPLAFAGLMVLAACNNNGGSKDVNYGDVSTKITIWATAAEEQVIKAVVDAYNAKQSDEKSKFNYEFKAVSEGDCGSTLSKDPTVAGAPALALVADDQIYGLQSKSIVLELKGTYKDGVVKNNSAVAVTGASYGEHLYGFPVTSDNGYFLWYNADELTAEQAGSLESIMAVCEQKNKQFNMELANGYYVSSVFMSPQVCGTESLKFASDAEGKVSYTVNWDNEKGAAAAAYISDLLAPKYTAGTFTCGGNEAVIKGFTDGDMIAAISGTWLESGLSEAAEKQNFKLAATKLPTFKVGQEEKQMASFSGSKVYVINKTRPVAEQKVAAALADLLTNKESQLKRFELRKTLPCNLEAAKDERYTKNVSISGAALTAQNAYAAVQSTSAQDRYWAVGEAIGTAMRDAAKGEMTWAEFLKSQLDILRAAV